MKEMRKLVTQLVKPPHHQNARKQVNIRDLMPSVPKDSAEPYKKLYENTKAWTNNIKTKINALDDARKKEEANALMDAAKIAVGEMAAMRTAGYKNAKYEAFSAEFRGKATATTDGEEGEKYRVELYVKDIKPENNGGVSKYKEVDREELDKKGTGAALEMIKWMDEWDAKDTFSQDPRDKQMRSRVRPAFRVFPHRKRDSSRLLNLPDEILWRITEFIADQERGHFLSFFALAHRECRQLARPHQFSDVWITRSETSWELLRHIKRETEVEGPAIGTFIRSLTITVDEDLCLDYGCATDDEYEQWRDYWQGLIDDLTQVLESRSAMPNVERVFWMDTGGLEVQPRLLRVMLQKACPSLSGCLSELHFADYKFLFEDIDDVAPSMPATPSLSIRSMSFGYDENHTSLSDALDGCTAYLAEIILRRSALTLESFVWNAQFKGEMAPEDDDGTTSLLFFRDGPIAFNQLRKFWCSLTADEGIQPSVLESFLAAPLLENFSPSAHVSFLILAHGLVEKFPLPNLRTFAVSGISATMSKNEVPAYVDTVLTLAGHYAPQIEELFVYLQGNPKQLTTHFSTHDFRNLRSLCFSWPHDPELVVLQAIGTHLTTLEELSFGFQPANDRTGFEDNTWDSSSQLSHEAIIAAISPLKNLVRLCVFGDEYVADWSGDHWAWHRFFEQHVDFHQGRSYTVRKRGHRPGEGQLWSEAIRGHKNSGHQGNDWITRWITNEAEEPYAAMLGVATRYASALPKLQEFIGGRVLVEIANSLQ
ncbi:hypothetical protein HER10_EVM0005498 [Colletotrichum scovillei]|uniref:uncharacterized protein n=1 Tax=Colletotrichum scovillei TaxID=1209932 RepID=UPI0015C3F23D|nr:uncharacterized protein HER10_EVM0005498 [Colletotrichum scovillei]KAF4772794.1 hypothetical protein HER10_EVM0005498 [Colletotrichum scovillei]